MKKDGVIRISFIICAAFIIAAFWAGFYFGNTKANTASSAADRTSELYIENETDTSETMTDISKTADNDLSVAETDTDKNEIAGLDGGNRSEESTGVYYLKRNENYLSVYQEGSEDVYFDTGIKISDLPDNLQEKAETGIAFDSLEELYGFLENYSS